MDGAPGEIDRWWRSRQAMTLVPSADGWRVEGPGSDRARIAYLTHEAGQVVCESSARRCRHEGGDACRLAFRRPRGWIPGRRPGAPVCVSRARAGRRIGVAHRSRSAAHGLAAVSAPARCVRLTAIRFGGLPPAMRASLLSAWYLPATEPASSLAATVAAVVMVCWGAFLLCFGRTAFRAGLFPLLFLVFMIPLPPLLLDSAVEVLKRGSPKWSRHCSV